MKILLDFDDTLFHTAKFKEDLIGVFESCGVSPEDFKKHYYDYPPNDKNDLKRYVFESHIDRLEEVLGIDGANLRKKAHEFLSDTSEYLFSDVKDFLKSFSKDDLLIISFGCEFLKIKIGNTGIGEKVSEIVTTDKLKEFATKKLLEREEFDNEKIFFLDDRIDHLGSVKSKFPDIISILVRRPEGRYDCEMDESCDYCVRNLLEAKELILGS
jgi:FMN phosphatase YigB (HAD superfamily)